MHPLTKDLSLWQPVQPPGAVNLQGLYVTLEPLSASSHAHDLWQAVQGHDEVWAYLGDGPYFSEEALVQAIAAKETGVAARFFAILPKQSPASKSDPPSSAEAKGYASLMRFDPANGVIEAGNILFSPALQRTAAATETIYLLARHIFEDLGYRRFEWKCNALNLPSRRAAERFGFTFEGIFRQHMIVKGQSRDTAWYSMLDSEWPARKRVFDAWLSQDNFDHEGRQRQTLATFRKMQEALPSTGADEIGTR